MMKKRYGKQRLLGDTGLQWEDAVRLIREGMEELHEMAQRKNRRDMIRLLRRVIQEGARAVRESERTVSFSTAAWGSVEARSGLRAASRRDLRHFVRRMLRVEMAGELSLRRMDTQQCRSILQQAFGRSPSSFQKGRAIMHSIFAFGMRRGWCDANPVQRIEVPRFTEKEISPLSPGEVERLRAAVERPENRDMKLSLFLMLYSGVRPTEVSRLRPQDIFWDEKHVVIRSRISKTGGGRIVPLRGFREMRRQELVIPRNWFRRWRALRRAAGFIPWSPDVLRHTFASYHASYFRNLPLLQWEMGHRDASLLYSRYVVPTRRAAAALFWKRAGCGKEASLRKATWGFRRARNDNPSGRGESLLL